MSIGASAYSKRWWIDNIGRFLLVGFVASFAGTIWFRMGSPPDPYDSGFVTDLLNAFFLPLLMGYQFTGAAYLLLIYARKIRTRLGALIASPMIALPSLLFVGMLTRRELGSFLVSVFVPAFAYGVIVRLREAPTRDAGDTRGRTHRPAIVSLVLGLGGLVLLPGILSIPAIVLGRRARARIQQDRGLEGKGLASAAIVLGWIGVGLIVLLLIPLLTFVVMMVFQVLI